MIAFLERLKKRKTEVARKSGGEWQALVIAVAAGEEQDANTTLIELERLNKTPEDLASAVALLGQRRELVKQVAAGAKAEAEFQKINAAIDGEVAKFTAASELHDATMRPLVAKKETAVEAISAASFARRRLQETATDPIRLAAISDTDAKMAELRREKAAHAERLKVKADALHKYSEWPERFADAASTLARLQVEVETMQAESRAFDAKAEVLSNESDQARKRLEAPEAI